MRHTASVLASAAIAGSLALGPTAAASAAAPPRNPNETSMALSCANGFTGNAVLRRSLKGTHHMRWFVLQVTGGLKGEEVLTATKIDVTFTYTSRTDVVTANTENISKKSHAPHQTTCTISGTKTVGGGSLTARGDVTGAFH